MKVVILAGGLGTRISEETELRPKPMVPIGGRPILWHVMKIYASQGYTDFVVCLGYKGYLIKEYFANYFLHMSDVTFDLARNHMEIHDNTAEPWRVTLIDTGADTQTGGRVKRVQRYVGDAAFMVTYGDGVGDVDLAALLAYHREHGRHCTVTGVQPVGRFGALDVGEGGVVERFREKPLGDGGWINGGFFVMEPAVFDYISSDLDALEAAPMERLAAEGQLRAYLHDGFWHPMDTLRDKTHLEELWRSGQAAWAPWSQEAQR